MDTPRTMNRVHRPPLGTPTMSNSKKSLFGKDVEDEADIGPMTPLRFGSLRRNHRRSNNALSNITSFRNLFGNESPDSERSLSPDFERRYTNNGRYELVSADFNKENMAHAVDEETRFSFNSSISETPCSRLSAEESAVLDENNSNSLSMLMNSDLNLVEKRTKSLHRTPGLTTRTQAKNKTTQRSVDPCLRRTQQQQFHGVKRAHTGTPDNSSQSPSYIEIERSAAKRPNTRARTALHFNDILPIPTKSFYSSAPVPEKHTPVKIHAPISSKSFYASSASKPQAIAITDHLSPENERSIPTAHKSPAAKQASTSKTPRKATSMRKRTKSFSSNAPRLGQRGTVHKIRKPVKKSAEPQTPKKRGSRYQQKNRAIAGGTKSCPTTPKSGNNTVELEHDEMLRQLKHVNRILRQGQKNLTRARPLSMSLSMTDLSKGALSCEEDANSSSSEDEDSVPEQEDEDGNGDAGKRKFFRSSRKSRSIRRVYNHFNAIAIDVQKGGKRKVLNFPHTPKRRRIGFEQDDFNFENEQLEVDDLISKLHEGDGCESLDDDTESRHHIAMPVQNDEDDEPIPIQSNVIYLSADDEFALANNGVEQSMEPLEPDHGNGMVIIHHNEAEAPVDIVEGNESVLYSCNYDTVPDVNEQYTGFIANNSTIIIQHNEYRSSSTSYHNDSSISTTIMNSSTVSQYQYQPQCQVDDTTQTTANQEANAYYSIFYADRVKERWRQERQQTATEPRHTDVFQLLRQQDNHGRGTKSQRRHGVGQDQYQIDAGQRAYGAIQCKECGLTYSTNEPEEEQFHDVFHRSQAKLTFTGGPHEHVAAQVPEWDVTGRIIVVSQTDSNKHLLRKIHGVLEVVDSELGFSTQGELPEGACVYLAIARSTVLGICVVQPLQYANRMICLEGLHGVPIDCYSSEFYPARCGISRLWVAPKYRRHGIGRKLMDAIRHHYIFGYTMTMDEIAFGAPTEMGKVFAEKVSGRKDFLVYI
ncbi:N-acetyltransferase eco [Anopheles moucheti]|uniref:N-acetyltransferase eco n=1 Tax=Anopheles moucheti TaxID=186751 RepID=UPI0022F12D0B|nr:N-acetyltransferase eco [Anopheles moucheti]